MPGLELSIETMPRDGKPERFELMVKRAAMPPVKAFRTFAGRMRGSVASTFREGGQETKWKKSGRVRIHGGKTLQDTGRLRASITFKPGTDSLKIGTSDKRARLLFKGGIVRPKRAKALTIPLDPSVKRRAREYADTFIAKGVIFQKRDKKIIPLFALKKQVEVPARRFIEVTKADRLYLDRLLVDHYTGE